MKTEKIIWGLALVFVGSILLLDNFGIINFYWRSVWQFWPIILILLGLNMVLGRNKSTTVKTTIIGIFCLFLVLVAYVGSSTRQVGRPFWDWSFGDDKGGDLNSIEVNAFSELYTADIKQAELHIEGGATSYVINDSTANLLEADVERSYGRYTLSKTSKDSTAVLNFKMQGKKAKWDFEGDVGNKATIRLNTRPLWSISLEMGAGKADFDLSGYRVGKLQIKGGAAAFDVKLGQPAGQMAVSVETGMAGINLSVPENVACQIKVDTGLSSKDFEGFEKQEDGTYQTPNFNSSAKKILINLKGGLSDFEVSRY